MITDPGVFLILAMVFLGAGLLWSRRRRAVRARLGTWEDVLDRARQGGYRLMDAMELAQARLAHHDRLLLVDTRPREAYEDGHIDGAVSFPLAPTWRARLFCRGELAARLGPDRERPLFFY